MGAAAKRRNLRGDDGFTLPELLVAIAIFISVMAGITLLFNGSIRTVRQGYQSAEAFEQARGALNVIERDLTQAFVSREYGDYYHFYGNPIGFTFVGLVDVGGTDAIARVTCVIYGNNRVRVGSELDDPFIDFSSPTFQFSTTEEEPVHTYSLLRYIERDREDLDSLPVNWQRDVRISGIPGFEGGMTFNAFVQMLIDDACLELGLPNADCPDPWQNFFPNIDDRLVQLVQATKRQLWIMMLAGGDELVPNAWTQPWFRLHLNNGVPPSPFRDFSLDWVVAENVHAYVPPDPEGTGENLHGNPVIDEENFPAPPTLPFDPFNVGAIPFFAYHSGQNSAQKVAYWDDVYGASLFEVVGASQLGEPVPINLNLPGNPLLPRIPTMVTVNFVITMGSPYPGAPDFNRHFAKTIDVPTGYARGIGVDFASEF